MTKFEKCWDIHTGNVWLEMFFEPNIKMSKFNLLLQLP